MLQAIRENPGDVSLVLIHADWLEENGRELEAHAIRTRKRIGRAAALPPWSGLGHHDIGGKQETGEGVGQGATPYFCQFRVQGSWLEGRGPGDMLPDQADTGFGYYAYGYLDTNDIVGESGEGFGTGGFVDSLDRNNPKPMEAVRNSITVLMKVAMDSQKLFLGSA